MAFTRLRTVYKRRKASASPEQHPPRPRTAPATTNASTSTPSLLPPLPPRDPVDTTTLHSSLAPVGHEPRHYSSALALATSAGIHEEGDSSSSPSPGGDPGGGGGNADREELIQHMRDQLSTANSVIRFLHEHVDGMREDRDKYRDRVEELKSLAKLTLDMLEGAHQREWEVCREVRRVKETAITFASEEGGSREREGPQRQKTTTTRRRRDSLMRKIGLGGKKEGREREKEKERTEVKTKHDSAREEPSSAQMFAFKGHPSPTLPPDEPVVQHIGVDRGGAGVGSSSNARRKKGHVKSHSSSHARLRDDGALTIPGDELERLVQAMDRNVNALREDIKKLVDEVNTHKHHPVYTSLTDIPPRFG